MCDINIGCNAVPASPRRGDGAPACCKFLVFLSSPLYNYVLHCEPIDQYRDLVSFSKPETPADPLSSFGFIMLFV